MAYNVSGVHLLNACEYASESDVRGEAPLSTSPKYTWGGKTFKEYYGVKLINYVGGYIYSKDAIGGKYRMSNASYTVSAKGHRPLPTVLRYSSTTPGKMYVNKFANGDVYVSSTKNSASGTYLGNMHYIFAEAVGAGAGGGPSSGSSSSGGGGGGAYIWLCMPIRECDENFNVSFRVGAGGRAPTHSGDIPGSGESTYIGCDDTSPGYESFTWRMLAGGGSGGQSGSASGNGGAAGTPTDANRDGSAYVIYTRDGAAGGAKNSNGTGTPSISIGSYAPDGSNHTVSAQSGGSGNLGGGGGSGYLGVGGKGGAAYEDGSTGGTGSGGGGAAYVWFSSRNGGAGGNGSIKLYY